MAEEGERLRTTLASIGDAVITTDAEGRITSLNAVAEALTGRTKAEATGQPLDLVFRIVNEETRQTVQNPATRALHEGVIVGLSSRTLLIARDGKERPIDDSAAPIRGKAGEIVGCVLVFRDISQRRRLDNENASRFRDARLLAAIVESSEDAIIGKTLDGIIQSWNAAAERLFGFPAGQAVGRHISLIIPADRTAEEDQIIATLKAGRRIEHYETVRLRCDGQPVLVSLTISPIKDEAGRVIGASKIARDITRQRQAEERERLLLAEAATANAKFRAFFEQGALFAGIMDVDGTILEPNRLSWEGCGFTREQIVGKPFWEGPWWTPSAALVERIKAASAQAAAGQTFRAEMPYFVADGSERVADVTILPIKDEAGRVVFLAPTGVDITDRKRAEADRQKFVTLVENSTDFIGMCDLEGVPFFVNRAGLQMVGLDGIEQARRTPVRDFFYPEDQPRIMDEFFPSVLLKGHGEMEVRFRHFKTGKARWMAYKVLTLTDATGRAVGLATVSQDVTERRRLEDDLRRLAADLSEADRRKDEFLATLAHELRNPLAPIRNALQVIRLSPDREAHEQARSMMGRQLEQMVRLVDDLMDVSRISRGKLELRKEQVQLSAVVTSAVETSRPMIDHLGHELTVMLPKQPIIVDADLTRLAQVFSNLLNNSAKYMDRGGHIRLTAERQGSDVVVVGEGHRHRHRRRPVAPHLRDVLAGGPLAGAVAGRAGDRADPGEAAGRDARRSDRGQERGAGQGGRVRRPLAGRGGGIRAAGSQRGGRASSPEVVAPHPDRGRQPGRCGQPGDAAAAHGQRHPHGLRRAAGGGRGRGVPARRHPARHRPAEAERLRGVPTHPGTAVGKKRGPHRRDGVGAGGRPPPLPRGGIRLPHGQAGGPARPREAAGRVAAG